MNIQEARNYVGKMVMSRDAGYKMIHCVADYHGPYKLLKITKGGAAILEGKEDLRIPPSLLLKAK